MNSMKSQLNKHFWDNVSVVFWERTNMMKADKVNLFRDEFVIISSMVLTIGTHHEIG